MTSRHNQPLMPLASHHPWKYLGRTKILAAHFLWCTFQQDFFDADETRLPLTTRHIFFTKSLHFFF